MKFSKKDALSVIDKSLPSRERGLKFDSSLRVNPLPRSLPSRQRGLKLQLDEKRNACGNVAPFAGAWIEIN